MEAPSAVVYRVLFEARDEELARGAAPLPMSIDEAHYYFPQEGAREDFNKEAAVINKLTRLGRMGVVFAAHSPAGLNDLVIQLTKIAMRSVRCLNIWLNTPGLTPRAEPLWPKALSTGHTL